MGRFETPLNLKGVFHKSSHFWQNHGGVIYKSGYFDSFTTQESVHLRCETEWVHLGPLPLKDRSIWDFSKIMGFFFINWAIFDSLTAQGSVHLRCETEWVHLGSLSLEDWLIWVSKIMGGGFHISGYFLSFFRSRIGRFENSLISWVGVFHKSGYFWTLFHLRIGWFEVWNRTSLFRLFTAQGWVDLRPS